MGGRRSRGANSFTYFIAFGVNVFEFAPIDFYVRAALVGNAGLFAGCAVVFTFLFVRWLSKPDLTRRWVSMCLIAAVLTIALPFGVGCYHAWLVGACSLSASPYAVTIATSCEIQNGADGEERCERSLSLVGIIGDRVILYDGGAGNHDGQRTIALRSDDVKSIEWETTAIQSRRSWWWPSPCAWAALGRWVGNRCG